MKKNYTLVTRLSAEKARKYFLKSENYFSSRMPDYISFQELLDGVSEQMHAKSLEDVCKKNKGSQKLKTIWPSCFEEVNYGLFCNKDGHHAWRHIQFIHPVIYVALVNKLTKEQHWGALQAHFEKASSEPKVQCFSIPKKSNSKKSDKAESITAWWREIERQSIELALEFAYLAEVDIAACYPSIYTHSIVWALDEKIKAKKKRRNQGK